MQVSNNGQGKAKCGKSSGACYIMCMSGKHYVPFHHLISEIQQYKDANFNTLLFWLTHF